MPTTYDTSFMSTMPANTAVQFWDRVAKSADREAFRYPTKAETWESVTWAQAMEAVRTIAARCAPRGARTYEPAPTRASM